MEVKKKKEKRNNQTGYLSDSKEEGEMVLDKR